MQNLKEKNWSSIIVIILLLWNPITLLLLFKNYVIAFFIPAIILSTGLYIYSLNDKYLRIKVWAFNICAILSIAYHAELIFINVFPEKNIPNLYQIHDKYYFNKPNLNRNFNDDEYVSLYKTNCQGYRIDRLSNANDSIKYCDWMFIGDSYTQGAQVDYPDLFSSLLYRYFPDKIIVNAGISGAGLYDELNYYKDMGHLLKPKRVFLQIGVFNDFFNVEEKNASFQDWLMCYSDLFRYLEFNLIGKEDLSLKRWTEPFFANIQKNTDYNILYKKTSPQKEKDKTSLYQCIKEFNQCIKQNGGELVLLLIPSKEQVSDEMLDEVVCKYNIQKSDLDMTYPNRWIQDLANKIGIKLIDLYDDFRTSKDFPFFYIDEHMNYVGHHLIAKRVSSYFLNEAFNYNYLSQGNTFDRYPTIYDESRKILYQSQDEHLHQICTANQDFSKNEIVWRSLNELIHPVYSPDKTMLAFTEGNQEKGCTDVILYNFITEHSLKINAPSTYGAMPTFSHTGDLIAYANWDKSSVPGISVYDIKQNTIYHKT